MPSIISRSLATALASLYGLPTASRQPLWLQQEYLTNRQTAKMWNDEDNNPYSSFDRRDSSEQTHQTHGK